jgi:hypothetical protein
MASWHSSDFDTRNCIQVVSSARRDVAARLKELSEAKQAHLRVVRSAFPPFATMATRDRAAAMALTSEVDMDVHRYQYGHCFRVHCVLLWLGRSSVLCRVTLFPTASPVCWCFFTCRILICRVCAHVRHSFAVAVQLLLMPVPLLPPFINPCQVAH